MFTDVKVTNILGVTKCVKISFEVGLKERVYMPCRKAYDWGGHSPQWVLYY